MGTHIDDREACGRGVKSPQRVMCKCRGLGGETAAVGKGYPSRDPGGERCLGGLKGWWSDSDECRSLG